jgi:hypothetical protein
MYIFTLGTDVEKIVKALRSKYGEFVLVMLYNDALEAASGWNLIVSAPWTDKMGMGEATRVIARALNQGLESENQRAISRITVLKTSDPFVRDMTKLYPVTEGPIPVGQVTAGEINEGSGFVFHSQHVE